MYWMTPEELCDIVEEYTDLILVYYNEYSCGASEDMCCVRLFEKSPPGREPIEFFGLYPFASTSDALSYGQDDWPSVPEYARAMPRLADVRGKYHFNFCRGSENWLSEPFDPKEGIAPESLWAKLYPRKLRFLSDLTREEEAAKKRADEEKKRREEEVKQSAERDRIRDEEEAKRRAEEGRRLTIQEKRKSQSQCVMCGRSLTFFDRLLKREKHSACTSFKE